MGDTGSVGNRPAFEGNRSLVFDCSMVRTSQVSINRSEAAPQGVWTAQALSWSHARELGQGQAGASPVSGPAEAAHAPPSRCRAVQSLPTAHLGYFWCFASTKDPVEGARFLFPFASKDHRTVWTGRHLKAHPVPAPCQGQGWHHQIRLHKASPHFGGIP